MKKRGFTLIELLAVLVILAVIALIIMPIVTNVVKGAKKAAFKESVNNIIESTDNYIGDYVLTHNADLVYPVTLICNGTTCEDTNGTKLTFKGAVPKSGKIILENAGSIRADLVSNGEWCASGLKGMLEVYEDCTSLDHTNPEIDESKLNDIVISTTTNTLTVSIPDGLMYDHETGIAGYNVEIYLGSNKVDSKSYSSPNITFTNLKNNTEYKVVITGINGNGGKTSIDKYGTTLDMTKPTITYTNDPTEAVGGYFKSQTLNVSFNQGDVVSPSYYIRSGRDASTNIDVIASCGTGDEPSSCTSMTSISIEANTWYKVSGNISVIYNVNANEESYLTALIYDGTNYGGADTKTVGKIDATKPEVSSVSVSGKVATINKADTGSGLASYCVVASNNSSGCSWAANTAASVTWTASSAGTYYAFTKDAVGNVSDSKSFTIASSAFCSYTANQAVGTYNYTGGVQSYKVPDGCSGKYKLEVWGAQGGTVAGNDASGTIGKGGYATGTINLTGGTTIYIYVGGQGGVGTGGWNGGGAGGYNAWYNRAGGGGGATHIAKTNRGVLSTYNSYRGDVYIVAGGGGGAGGASSWAGNGGGTSGANGGNNWSGGSSTTTGGSQTAAGGASGSHWGGWAADDSKFDTRGGFGYGGTGGHYCEINDDLGTYPYNLNGGGGGGWFGGGGGNSFGVSYGDGGGGGSSYIGGVSGGSTTAGQKTGNGQAKITFVSLN